MTIELSLFFSHDSSLSRLIDTTPAFGSKIFLSALFNYLKSSVAMHYHPLREDFIWGGEGGGGGGGVSYI